jgi:L-alanine-DL-glutamate epimerase-like enolase superfamily enzyme
VTAPTTPVTGVEVAAYKVPTDTPEADGTLAWDSTTIVVVRASGAGETGTGWTYGPPACGHLVTDLLAPIACGADVQDTARTHGGMVRAVRNAGRPGIASMAVSAVDTALWDLRARVLGMPLHRLLGGRSDVPLYGSGGFTTYDDRQLEQQLHDWLEQGLRAVKIKIGEDWGGNVERDLSRIRQARRAIGNDVALFVDANGGYTAKQAIRVADRFAEDAVSWYEEPVSSDDLAGLRRVRDHVAADVTAGEYGYDLTYFERMCDAQAVDCLQVDVTRCGGITEWQRIAAVAAGHDLEVSAHCAPHVTFPVASATPGFRHVEWFHDHVRLENLLFDGTLEPCGGRVTLTDAPGHGLTLRPGSEIDRYRVL